MMTLKEAIKHCKDVALSCSNKECALEHFQLLKWLQEYSNILEKQGEQESIDPDILIQQRVDALADIVAKQKPADKVEPKFQNGQWVVWQNKCYKVNYNGCGYELIDQNGLSTLLEYETIDESAHLWTIQDAKDGDVLVDRDKAILLFRSIGNNKWSDAIDYYTLLETNMNNRFSLQEGDAYWGKVDDCSLCPATKEQHNALEKAMANAGYTFDFDKKELKKIIDKKQIKKNLQDNSFRRMFEQNSIEPDDLIEESYQQQVDNLIDMATEKHAWSEENKEILDEIIDFFENGTVKLQHDLSLYASWLKSLRPQNTWKPSNKQMEALEIAVNDWMGDDSCIVSLYNDLKNLQRI